MEVDCNDLMLCQCYLGQALETGGLAVVCVERWLLYTCSDRYRLPVSELLRFEW